MTSATLSSTDVPEFEDPAEVVRWMREQGMQAVYVDAGLYVDNPALWSLIEAEIGDGFERVFEAEEGNYQVLLVTSSCSRIARIGSGSCRPRPCKSSQRRARRRRETPSLAIGGRTLVCPGSRSDARCEISAVSIIVPCFNEEPTIGLLLQAIARPTVGAGDAGGGPRRRRLDRWNASAWSGPSPSQHPALRIRLDRESGSGPSRLPSTGPSKRRAARSSSAWTRTRSRSRTTWPSACASWARPEAANAGGVWEIHPSTRHVDRPRHRRRRRATGSGAGDARYRTSGAGRAKWTRCPSAPTRAPGSNRVGPYDESPAHQRGLRVQRPPAAGRREDLV